MLLGLIVGNEEPVLGVRSVPKSSNCANPTYYNEHSILSSAGRATGTMMPATNRPSVAESGQGNNDLPEVGQEKNQHNDCKQDSTGNFQHLA